MKLLKYICLIAAGTVVLVSTSTAQQRRTDSLLTLFYKQPETVLVAAHRGAHRLFPENSLPSIAEAIRVGAHIVELDVRETKDGELVVIHDRTVDRTTDGSGKVEAMLLHQLRALRLTQNGERTPLLIPTLREALLRCKDSILVDIDFKAEGEETARKVCELVQELEMEEQVLFFLYDYTHMQRLHAQYPAIKIMPRAYSAHELAEIIDMDIAPVIHIDDSYYNRDLMQTVRGKGIRIWANTLGEFDRAEDGYSAFFRKMPLVNVVQTDDPERLLRYLSNTKAVSTATKEQLTVSEAMDGVITRLYDSIPNDRLNGIDERFLLNFITAAEREAFAAGYWRFRVNVPVVVSLMRDSAQATIPFWLEPSGFEKTDMHVRNSHYTYEVWQKRFPAGEINLGINGFDKHRPVYFVSVAPQDGAAQLMLEPIFPAAQHIDTLDTGSFTYHDWDGLTLTEVPGALRGQLLLTTVRGRAREAHVIHAFRKTAFPAGAETDQLTLTLGQDPSSMTVQWRTDTTVKHAWVSYWQEGRPDTGRSKAALRRLEDRLLVNDRYNHRFLAKLSNLSPGGSYYYQVHGESGPISEVFRFGAAPKEDMFSFNWFGDTHNDAAAGELIKRAYTQDPSASFSICSGDVVNTGLHRDDWDKFFRFAGDVFARQPFMAVPGNHDSQDGLGAAMFRSLLNYPANGPVGLPGGYTYSFSYKNAMFVMIDAASFPMSGQTRWLAETLASSNAAWKFVVLHFPPYNEVEPYPEIVQHWVPLFEQYGVDMVMAGHFHYYLRSHPMKAGARDETGVTYLMSVATTAGREAKAARSFVAKRIEAGNFYQHFRVEGNQLIYKCYDAEGLERDRLILRK